MALQVSYMGTKRQLAPLVAEVVSQCPSGPLLDLFSGIGSVGAAVSDHRQIWNNDAQLFANTVARSFFTSQDLPPAIEELKQHALKPYQENKAKLTARFNRRIAKERSLIDAQDFDGLKLFYQESPHVAISTRLENERKALALAPTTFPYRLFSITFAGGYLGIKQSVEVDSIRYAIDVMHAKKNITADEKTWSLVALCQALSKCSTTTGHFAQFIKVKESNFKHFAKQRGRSIWDEWLAAFSTFQPFKDASWRSANKVFREDAETLVGRLDKRNSLPSVIYADPPYTADQYSRYYHLYETILQYDYPASSGIGRYRPDRFVSRFSLKTAVAEAFENLISNTARLGCELVLSYPENGLFENTKENILSLLGKHFTQCEIAHEIQHKHSSMGGSQGKPKYQVNELIFYAR
ncbi:MAG: DNA adenine methylase [Rickettsiales bacterium]